jgi:hypothetical protein
MDSLIVVRQTLAVGCLMNSLIVVRQMLAVGCLMDLLIVVRQSANAEYLAEDLNLFQPAQVQFSCSVQSIYNACAKGPGK